MMMSFSDIFLNAYGGALIAALIIFVSVFYGFTKKFNIKLENKKKNINKKIKNKYRDKEIKVLEVVKIFSFLKKETLEYNKIKRVLNYSFIGGAIYCLGCLINMIGSLFNFSEWIGGVFILPGLFIFMVLTALLFYWDYKNEI